MIGPIAGPRCAPPRVDVERRADGTMILRSPEPLGPYARAVGEWLEQWASRSPQRCFLAERSADEWRRVTYAEALEAVRRIGGSLLARGLTRETPVAILSDNSINHALLALGAMHVGVPVAPISPAYSLMSKDHAKLKDIFELLQPRLVFVEGEQRFAPALAAVGAGVTPIDALLEREHSERVEEAFRAIGPDTVAKILFTSGSTGTPKGVINTQRMLCSNQQSWAQVWPFLEDAPPVLCEWLPWNHTFGGNGTFNMVLRNGGTFYIDGGKPTPDLIATTARNLREVSPTIYFNVPRGYEALLPFLREDAQLRKSFFSRLGLLQYAAAVLPQPIWKAYEDLAVQTCGERILWITGYGATETAPAAMFTNRGAARAGTVGLPVDGVEMKLAPVGDKLEARFRGPSITPGYWRQPELTQAAFDEEGYYRTGDAMRFVDSADPRQGFEFDGRITEDFKLTTGTWVHVGAIRVKLIAAADPLVQDAVITGHGRSEIGALVFLSPAAKNVDAAELRARLQGALSKLAQEGGSSTHPRRLLVMTEPPSIDANEITDKGYMNQRAVLERRALLVEKLYAGADGVITAG